MKQMPLLTAAALWLSPLSETNATKPQAVKQASKSSIQPEDSFCAANYVHQFLQSDTCSAWDICDVGD